MGTERSESAEWRARHYGKNVELPEEGTYTIRLRVDPPTFTRHDRENGNRYGEPVIVEFEGVDIETGQD